MTTEHLPLFNAQVRVHEKYHSGAGIVLFTGDAETFVQQLPSRSVKLIFTSPPYNIGKEYESRMSLEAYIRSQSRIASEFARILRDDGSLCWQVGNYVQNGEIVPLDILYYDVFKSLGFHLRNRIIWRFEHGLHASRRFSGRYETILWFTKTDTYTFNLDAVRVPAKYPGKRHYKGPNRGKPSGNPLGKNPSDYWEIIVNDWDEQVWNIPNVKCNHPEKTTHPCQFPVELVERCVLALSDAGDLVYDPYAGVGTTVIAAIKHNRRGTGSERESQYVDIARQRISRFLNGTLPLRPMGKPVFQPTGREKVSQRPSEWSDQQQDLPCEEKARFARRTS